MEFTGKKISRVKFRTPSWFKIKSMKKKIKMFPSPLWKSTDVKKGTKAAVILKKIGAIPKGEDSSNS